MSGQSTPPDYDFHHPTTQNLNLNPPSRTGSSSSPSSSTEPPDRNQTRSKSPQPSLTDLDWEDSSKNDFDDFHPIMQNWYNNDNDNNDDNATTNNDELPSSSSSISKYADIDTPDQPPPS